MRSRTLRASWIFYPQDGESRKKLVKAVREFRGYIEANQNFISN